MIDRAHAALLVFDALKGHLQDRADGPVLERYAPMVANIGRLLAAARGAGLTVAYAAASHRRDLPTWQRTSAPDPHVTKIEAGTWTAEIVDTLRPEPRDLIVPKVRWSAFFGTSLDLAFRLRDVRTVVLCGAATEVGIASTAYAARDLLYDVVVVRDACAGRDAVAHDAFLRAFERLARVHSTDEVIAALH